MSASRSREKAALCFSSTTFRALRQRNLSYCRTRDRSRYRAESVFSLIRFIRAASIPVRLSGFSQFDALAIFFSSTSSGCSSRPIARSTGARRLA